MLSTVSPVMVGAEAASPQPTTPLSASSRTSTLSACLISTPAMNTGFFIGKLTAIGSMRLIFTVTLPGRCLLLELDQRAQKIPRMDEGDPLAGDVVLRLAVTQHAHPVAGKAARGLIDVVDAETEMMNAALRIALEELGDRRIRPRRRDQLDPGDAQLDIGETHALLGVEHRLADPQSVFLARAPAPPRRCPARRSTHGSVR